MDGRKIVLIICAIVALCAVVYLAMPGSREPAEEAKSAAVKPQKKARAPKSTLASRKQARPAPMEEDNASAMSREYTTAEEPRPQEPARSAKFAPPAQPRPGQRPQEAREEPKTEDEKAQELENRMQDFKERYDWDRPATMNMAEHLLGMIPKQFRDSGITAMMKNLEEAQQQGGSKTVDEAQLMQAVEKIIPEEYRQQLQQSMDKYKSDHP